MSDSFGEPPLESGLVAYDRGTIEQLPESPGIFRLRTSGQRVMFVGHAGDEGLRAALLDTYGRSPVAGVNLLEYSTLDSPDAAAAAAADEIQRLKPVYNAGFGRFRNAEISLPKKGHRIRKAMHNP